MQNSLSAHCDALIDIRCDLATLRNAVHTHALSVRGEMEELARVFGEHARSCRARETVLSDETRAIKAASLATRGEAARAASALRAEGRQLTVTVLQGTQRKLGAIRRGLAALRVEALARHAALRGELGAAGATITARAAAAAARAMAAGAAACAAAAAKAEADAAREAAAREAAAAAARTGAAVAKAAVAEAARARTALREAVGALANALAAAHLPRVAAGLPLKRARGGSTAPPPSPRLSALAAGGGGDGGGSGGLTLQPLPAFKRWDAPRALAGVSGEVAKAREKARLAGAAAASAARWA
jgi:hypothetical protein